MGNGAATQYLATSARWAVGSVLLAAGLLKLRSRSEFAQAISLYGVVPTSLVLPIAALLPSAEALLGLALLLGIAVRVAAFLSAVLLVAFVIAIAWNLARHRDIPCGCFGSVSAARVGPAALLRSFCLFLLAAVAALFANPYLSLEALWSSSSKSPLPLGDGVPLALLTVGAVLAYVAVQAILRLFEVREL